MRGITAKNGAKTAQHTRHSALYIANKDPEFDYCMRRTKDIQDGGGADMYGWEPITEGNSNGETFGALPFQKTSGRKQLVYMDTIACKRRKEVTEYFQAQDDERYNAQLAHVLNAQKRAKTALAQISPQFSATSKSKFSGPSMTQRTGPTEEERGNG